MERISSNYVSELIVDRKTIALAITFIEFVKFYLLFRNIRAAVKMKTVPTQLQPHVTNRDYQRLKRTAISHTMALMLTSVFFLTWKIFKLLIGFYGELWAKTINYGKTLTSRAVWYLSFDEFSNQVFDIPLLFLFRIVFPRRTVDPFIEAIGIITEVAVSALLSGLGFLLLIYATDKLGAGCVLFVSISSSALSIALVAVYVEYLAPMLFETLEDDLYGQSVKNLALQIGFDPEKIYIDSETRSPPNAYFIGLFGTKMILIGRSLFTMLEVRQLTSIVAHEFGHWRHNDVNLHYLFSLITSVGFGCTAIYSYGNDTLNRAFGFSNESPHPIVTVALTMHYIWPLAEALLNTANSVVGRNSEFRADDYSCSKGFSNSLREALLILEAKSTSVPCFDGWFSAWFGNHPTVYERVERIDRRREE